MIPRSWWAQTVVERFRGAMNSSVAACVTTCVTLPRLRRAPGDSSVPELVHDRGPAIAVATRVDPAAAGHEEGTEATGCRPGTGVLFGPELLVAAVAQAALLLLLGAGLGVRPLGLLVGGVGAALADTALAHGLRRSGATRFGPANAVTLARMTLVAGVTALVVGDRGTGTHAAALLTLASVALVLDAVDGPVARRTGTVSSLGARFDMEVDAFLILVLSVLVAGSLGGWVLAIGAMRYAFGVAGWLAPWLRRQLPLSMARKTVAAVQGIALVVASAPVVPRPLAFVVVGLALAALVWSFGRDVLWLWRRRVPLGAPNLVEL
jgi:phosphatidylglycerophosphate synthase